MNRLVAILAPTGVSAGIRDVLHDWLGAGLVDPFLWIEPPMVGPSRVSALSIGDGGRMSGIDLGELAGVERFDSITLAVLVPHPRGASKVSAQLAQTIANYLESSFGNAPVLRVRALILRPGDSLPAGSEVAVQGWHNIALSAEDSTGPSVGISQLEQPRNPVDFGIHAAADLCGLLGLWAGLSRSVLDDEPVSPGKVVRLSRSFFRKVGTSEVEGQLRDRVLSMDGGFPLPTHFGQPSIYIDDESLAARTMADQLWQRHAGILRGPRETSQQTNAKKIGALEAIRMFFGFIIAAVRNAPRAWVQRMVQSIKADAASFVHSAVFGAGGSAYEVVVDGVGSNGMPADWHELGDAAVAIEKALDDGGLPTTHEAGVDPTPLWQDYVSAALTLVDGGQRVAGLPPVQIGAQRGILRRSTSAIPSVTDSFSGVPPHLAAKIGGGVVWPFDVLGRFNLEQRLRAVIEQPVIGVAAAKSLQELGQWTADHSSNFAYRVGSRLGDSLYSTANEIRGLLDQIKQAASADNLVMQIQARQKRLARVMQVLLGIGLTVIVIVVALGVFSVISVVSAVIAGVAVLLVWVLVLLTVFVRGQRDLFGLINSRRELLAGEELARRNLRHAVRDARRLAETYSQFLSWSRVIGTVLREPFGRSIDARDTSDVGIVGTPRSVRLGVVSVDQGLLASAAAELRREIYSVGWLTDCWDSAIGHAHRQLGNRGVELEGQPLALFRQQGTGPDSLLQQWADSAEQAGVFGDVGDRLWSRVLTDLASSRQELRINLLAEVSDKQSAYHASSRLDQFMGGIDDEQRGVSDRFDGGLLGDTARAGGRTAVERSFVDSAASGLGTVVCLTQLSAAFADYELAALVPLADSSATGSAWTSPFSEQRPDADPVSERDSSALELQAPFDGQSF